jgi:hypothetical protein
MDEYYRTDESRSAKPGGMIDNSIAPVMRLVDWLVVLIISIIPMVNIIVMFIWAFGSTYNPNQRNFAKAFLLLLGVEMIVLAIFIGQFMGMIMKAMAMF